MQITIFTEIFFVSSILFMDGVSGNRVINKTHQSKSNDAICACTGIRYQHKNKRYWCVLWGEGGQIPPPRKRTCTKFNIVMEIFLNQENVHSVSTEIALLEDALTNF
jgi:hypothetical protein